jgi:hypothetical protein
VFATLLGPLPRPPLDDGTAPEALLDACLALQAEHGLDPVIDAGWPALPGAGTVSNWRSASARVNGLVKAVVAGPLSSGGETSAVRPELLDLADAGCRWIEVHEPAATTIGADPEARQRFADAHRSLTADLGPDVHLSLAVTGGSAAAAGIETILAGAYASLAIDLIAGPDNWDLAVAAPGDRGIVCGALSNRSGSGDGPETLLWAAGYAASTGGRGRARVGLATSGSLADLTWEEAAIKVRRLGEAARLFDASPDDRRAAVDPRAVDIRSAALGRSDPPRRRRSARPTDEPDRLG